MPYNSNHAVGDKEYDVVSRFPRRGVQGGLDGSKFEISSRRMVILAKNKIK